MSAIRALERMLEAGLPMQEAMEIARGFEADMLDYAKCIAAEMARDAQADRRRQKDRERKSASAIPQNSAEVPFQGALGFPEPLPNPPNLSQVPPIVPQKSARKAKAEPPKGAFAVFWADYPLKVGKLAAEKAYPRAWARQLEENPEVSPEAEILAGLGRCKAKWDPDFIPNPLTFLNQGRWMDVPEPDLPDSTGPPKFDLAAFEERRKARQLIEDAA